MWRVWLAGCQVLLLDLELTRLLLQMARDRPSELVSPFQKNGR